MTAAEFRTQSTFEESLQPGAKVEVRWTNSYRYFQAPATVVRKNRASVRVKLTDKIEPTDVRGGSYPVGHEIVVPLMSRALERWTANNGVFPTK